MGYRSYAIVPIPFRIAASAMVPHKSQDVRVEQGRHLPVEVIVLGASNVTYGLGTYVPTIFDMFPEGVRLLMAHGHGRSYGRRSRVFHRQLDGHIDSLLWPTWDQIPFTPARRYALLTDIGNDLIYGAPVETIMEWVSCCASRLQQRGCELAVSTLPLDSILSLSAWRYAATRRLFFPKTSVSWQQMRERVQHLDASVREFARSHGASAVAPRPEWYRFDPIHVHSRFRLAAVGEMLAQWPTAPRPSPRTVGLRTTFKLWRKHPARRWIGSREVVGPQPCESAAGGEIWFF